MNINTTITQNIDFKAKLYHERVKEKLEGTDWLDRNFGGATTEAEEDAEWEIRQEIDSNWERARSQNRDYDSYQSYYSRETERISNRVKEVDAEMKEHRSLHPFQSLKIKALQAKAFALGIRANISDKSVDNLEKKTDKKRDKSSELNRETRRIERNLNTLKRENETKIRTKVAELKENAMLEHNKKIDNLINSPLLYLKQNVVMPIKMLQKGKDFTAPNGILINTPLKSFSKLILRWITKNTNSNYAKLNAKKYKTEETCFEALSAISEKSRQEHAVTNKHSFTLITNIDKFLKRKNSPLIPFLKSFMDTTATDNFNTIILSSKKSSQLDSILTAKHRFPLKLDLSLKFLVKKYSFLSMLFKSFKIGTNRKNLKKLKLAH